MLITPDDVRVYLGRDLLPDDVVRCEMIIADLQAELENYLNTPLEITTFTETLKVPPAQRTLFLRHGPIVSVQSLKVDGVLVDAQDYVVQTWGIQDLLLVPSNVAGQPPTVDVTYTAGIDAASIGIFASGMRRAAARDMNRTADDAVGVDQLSLEGYATKYTAPGMGWLAEELASFDRYKRRGAFTQPTTPTAPSTAWASRITPF